MKKTAAFILTLLICAVTTVYAAKTTALAANTCALVGNAEIRAGDTLNLTFSMNGTGISGFTARLEYDSSLLTLTNINQLISSQWMVERNGDNIIVYDNSLSKPINTNTAVFTLVFKVNSSAATGAALEVKVADIVASNGSVDIQYNDAVYSSKIAKPKSTNADIGSLTVSNGELSPAFSSAVTEYTAIVEYSETSLSMTIALADLGANYVVTGNSNFIVGENTVKIKVTAESGAVK